MAETCLHNWVFFSSRSQEMIILVNQRNKYVLTFSRGKKLFFFFFFCRSKMMTMLLLLLLPMAFARPAWGPTHSKWQKNRKIHSTQHFYNDDGLVKYTFYLSIKVHTFIVVVLLRKHLSVKVKEWPLASKFSKFEYLPEICHFWQIRVLAKMVFFGNVSDSSDLPTFTKPCCTDSPDSPTFAKPFCEDSPDSGKASLASFTRVWWVWRVWQI
jgi:hypothetical protein